MKRTKREENAIVINFVLFLVLTLICGYVAYSYIYPNIIEIEQQKESVASLHKEYTAKEKKGISYKDFKSSYKNVLNSIKSTDSDSSMYIDSITKTMSEDFYKENFTNSSSDSYMKFIENLKANYNNINADNEQKEKLNFILPSYVENIADINLGETTEESIHYLTDFRFVNYIETLVDQFILKYDNPIGIKEIRLVEDYAVSESGDTLDKNIYYIPVELEMRGQKGFVLLFLYYLENVGNIYLDDNNEIQIFTPDTVDPVNRVTESDEEGEFFNKEEASKDMEEAKAQLELEDDTSESSKKEKIEKLQDSLPAIYKNDFFTKNIGYRRINNFEEKGEYNVFNNQIIDIETISFDQYIDSDPSYGSLRSTTENNLLKNINSQLKDNFSFKAKLRFYIKGLPKFKIEKLIVDTNTNYNVLQNKVNEALANADLAEYQKEQIKKINTTLKSLGDQLEKINQTSNGKTDQTLTEKYNSSYEIMKVIKEIEEDFNELYNNELVGNTKNQ